jgi:AcrR family transcriptional regulator
VNKQISPKAKPTPVKADERKSRVQRPVPPGTDIPTRHPADTPPPPRRQARGQRRIEQLLDAADTIFAQIGYERATTNAICAQAGVSPGTLYQFFPNKQAIAEALAARYLERLPETHRVAFDLASAQGPLADLISHVVDPFIALHRKGPGLEALWTGSVISAELTTSVDGLKQLVEKSLAALFRARCPQANRAEINRAAATSVQLVKSFLRIAVTGTPKQQREGITDLKTVLFRYLAPVLGE